MLIGVLTILSAEPREPPPITAVLSIKQVCSVGGTHSAADISEIWLTIRPELQTNLGTSEKVVHSLASTSVRHTPTATEVFVLGTVGNLNGKTVCLAYINSCLHT